MEFLQKFKKFQCHSRTLGSQASPTPCRFELIFPVFTFNVITSTMQLSVRPSDPSWTELLSHISHVCIGILLEGIRAHLYIVPYYISSYICTHITTCSDKPWVYLVQLIFPHLLLSKAVNWYLLMFVIGQLIDINEAVEYVPTSDIFHKQP